MGKWMKFEDIAISNYELLLRATSDDAAVKLGAALFPEMPETTVLALYHQRVKPNFSADGNQLLLAI